jgi:transcriptional regulator with XRE-family HTH domain
VKKSVYSPEQIVLQDLLKSLRVEAGFKQGDFAEKLQKPQSFVSRYESGAVMLDMPQLRQVSHALGLTLPELVNRYEDALKHGGIG